MPTPPHDDPWNVAARLGAIEYLVEIMWANALARESEDDSAAFKRAAQDRQWVLPPRSGPVDTDDLLPHAERLQDAIANMIRRIADRERTIRAQTAPARPNPR